MLIKKHTLWQILLIAVILIKFSAVIPAEIQAFGYLGYEGRLNLDALNEDNITGTENEDSYSEDRKINRANLDLLFHTFIYHPNFLRFDFGIGVVYTDASNTTSEVTENPPGSGSYLPKAPVRLTADDTSLDYSFNLSFFERKDYPFSLFYSQIHPPLSSAAEGAFISKNTRYGAKFLWNAPIIINLDAIHFDSKGASDLRIINESTDSTSFRAYKSLKNSGYYQLNFIHQIVNSNSGSQLNPINSYKNTSDNVNYDSQLLFGEKKEYELYLRADFESNRDAFEFDEYGARADLQWEHNTTLRSYYKYGHVTTDYADYTVLNDYAQAGLAYVSHMGINNTTDLLADQSTFSDSETRQFDVRNSTGYTTTFKGGSFSINGTFSVARNESFSDVSKQLVKEIITLVKGDYVYFTQPNIYINDPITVTTSPGNQPLTENEDYTLIRQNGTVKIQQIKGSGDLAEDGTVAVEYFIDPSNNRLQIQLGSLNSQINFLRYFRISANYSDSKLKLLEGNLSQNQVTARIRTNFIASIDMPIIRDLILGGLEYRQGNIDESTLNNLTNTKNENKLVYLQFLLFRTTSLYMSREDLTSNIVGAIGDDNDIDKITYRALLKIQASQRTNLSLTYDDSVDVGTIKRKYSEAAIRFDWQYRRLLVSLTGSSYKDKQDSRIRDRTALHLNLTRTF